MRWIAVLLLVQLQLATLAGPSLAHPLAPVGVLVEELEPDASGRGTHVRVTVKRARVQPRKASFVPRLPAACAVQDVERVEEADHILERHTLRCGASLVGFTIGVDGLSEADVDAVVQVRLRDGRQAQGLLDRSVDVFVVPARPARTALFGDFFRSGLLHLLGGLDHMLFVVGLALLMRERRRAVFALTAFTGGHLASMLAVVLGWLTLPSAIAELAIAATLVWLARAVILNRAEDRELPRPYIAAGGVGLVHGLGFASAFASAGVQPADLPVALGAFHVGIELGQIAVMLVAFGLIALARRRPRFETIAAHAIGAIAFMWLIERAVLVAG